MRFLRGSWLLVLPALAAACQLVDPASDVHEQEGDASAPPDSGQDATLGGDGGDAGDAASLDAEAATDALVDALTDFCAAQPANVVLCDDFVRPSADLLYDGGVWQSLVKTGADNAIDRFYGPFFEVLYPNGSRGPDSCYLRSFAQQPVAGKWALDFDLDGSPYMAGSGAPSFLTIAAIEFDYGDGGWDGGGWSEQFQLQVSTENTAQINLVVDGADAASKTYALAQTSSTNPFLSDPTAPAPCHITFTVYTPGAQTSTAISQCQGRGGTEGTHVMSDNYLPSVTGGGNPVVVLGIQTDGGAWPTNGKLDYTNVTLEVDPP